MSLFNERRCKRPRRYLAEVVTQDGRLLRRERYSTDTAAEAVDVFFTMWKYMRQYMPDPSAHSVNIYATADEPDAPPIKTIRIYR